MEAKRTVGGCGQHRRTDPKRSHVLTLIDSYRDIEAEKDEAAN
jgi:hypothetical protein